MATTWREQLQRYVVFGLGSFAANLLLLAGLTYGLGIAAAVAGGLSLAVMLLINFVLARRYVFQSTARGWHGELPRFIGATLAMRAAEYAMYLLLVETLAAPLTAMTVSLVVSNTVKFWLYRSRVFKEPDHGGA